MIDDNDTSRKLFAVTPPSLKEGPHRQRLRQELLQQMEKERIPMRSWKHTAAWAACFIAILAVTGWAGQKISRMFEVKQQVIKVTTKSEQNSNMIDAIVVETVVTIEPIGSDSDSPETKQIIDEIQKCIEKGRYTLVEKKKNDKNTEYIYSVVLSSGDEQRFKTILPLTNIAAGDSTFKVDRIEMHLNK